MLLFIMGIFRKTKANSDRHDPYPTPDMKISSVKPQIDKTREGIGGQREPRDVLKGQRKLPQDLIQNNLFGAKPKRE